MQLFWMHVSQELFDTSWYVADFKHFCTKIDSVYHSTSHELFQSTPVLLSIKGDSPKSLAALWPLLSAMDEKGLLKSLCVRTYLLHPLPMKSSLNDREWQHDDYRKVDEAEPISELRFVQNWGARRQTCQAFVPERIQLWQWLITQPRGSSHFPPLGAYFHKRRTQAWKLFQAENWW